MSLRAASESLLTIEGLTIGYQTADGLVDAVRDLSLRVKKGQILGVVGESGSGKSTLALAIMRYLPKNGRLRDGSITFSGQDLYAISERQMRKIWGAELGLVPQDPLSSLNPSIRVGEQIAEVLRRQLEVGDKDARAGALDWLDRVQIPDPIDVTRRYPHELSGGMQQRVMIAMALCTNPSLLILDEPTTNLDATTQATILEMILNLMEMGSTSALYITHNLGVVAQICDELAVLYSGEIVEQGATRALFQSALHPYTHALLESVPRLGENRARVRLKAIRGQIPEMKSLPSGCLFRERCPLAIEICEEHPPLFMSGVNRQTRCHRWEAIDQRELDASQLEVEHVSTESGVEARTPILSVQDLSVTFQQSSPLLKRFRLEGRPRMRALDHLSIEIRSGETLGLVGESGSGKTTLARAILGLIPPDEGVILLKGDPVAPKLRDRTSEELSMVQMVFQNPGEAFNPYLTIGESLQRPLIRLLGLSKSEAEQRVGLLLKSVQLPADYSQRLPGALSGGERQRVALARAFAASPELLLADEAVSSLDVSVQAAILNLLTDLQQSRGSSTLFISHDLAAVGYLADWIAVIYAGQLMEIAKVEDLFRPPYHPYTEALLSSIPLLDPDALQERIRLQGDLHFSKERPHGCPFETRCPRRLGEICRDVRPPWQGKANETQIYCHIPIDDLAGDQSLIFQFSSPEGAAQ